MWCSDSFSPELNNPLGHAKLEVSEEGDVQGDSDSPYKCVEMEFSLWRPTGRGTLELCASLQPWGRAASGTEQSWVVLSSAHGMC